MPIKSYILEVNKNHKTEPFVVFIKEPSEGAAVLIRLDNLLEDAEITGFSITAEDLDNGADATASIIGSASIEPNASDQDTRLWLPLVSGESGHDYKVRAELTIQDITTLTLVVYFILKVVEQ